MLVRDGRADVDWPGHVPGHSKQDRRAAHVDVNRLTNCHGQSMRFDPCQHPTPLCSPSGRCELLRPTSKEPGRPSVAHPEKHKDGPEMLVDQPAWPPGCDAGSPTGPVERRYYGPHAALYLQIMGIHTTAKHFVSSPFMALPLSATMASVGGSVSHAIRAVHE